MISGDVAKMKTAIVLLNWKGWSDTIACLESLMGLDSTDIGIFVCDNNSPDDSVQRIRNWSNRGLAEANARRAATGSSPYGFLDLSTTRTDAEPTVQEDGGLNKITLIQTGRNDGFASGNNVGLRHALANGFDYFWLLNNDTEVEPDALHWLIRKMESDSSIGMCGSTLIYFGQRDLVQNWGGASFNVIKGYGVALGAYHRRDEPIDEQRIESQIAYVTGASMFASRAFLEQVGLMDESYFLYWEEIDWAARARGKFKLGYASRSVIYHKVGASIGTNDFGHRSLLSDYYLNRNRIKYCLRYSWISLPFSILHVARGAILSAVRGDRQRGILLGRALLGLPFAKARK
jgi:hypothetical protein